MGAKLSSIYQEAQRIGGLSARVTMAMLTKISSELAQTAPDSPENIKLFESALATVRAKVAAKG